MGSARRMILNTFIMYGKMAVSVIVSLFTSRIILDALGVIDFGIYQVVAGVVTMFGFIDGSLSTATQRYITFELGKQENSNVSKVFSASVYNHIIMAVFIFSLIEVVGMRFLNSYINIPEDRMETAKFVFHFANLSLICRIILVPYRALINAHERMIIIAVIDSINLFLKLAGVIYLSHSAFDRLKVVGVLFFMIAFFTLFNYYFINKLKFKEVKVIKSWDKKLFVELFSFGSYTLVGNLSAIARNQGFAILLNMFFGPLLNAAFGVANQVKMQIASFTDSILTAVNPQLVKRYAAGEIYEMTTLLYQSSKWVYFLLLLLASPILFDTEYILDLWLKDIPEHTVIICQLMVIGALIEVTTHPIYSVIMATGKIKKYQLITGGLLICNIPISYVFLKLGYDFYIVFYVYILLGIAALLVQLVFVKILTGISIRQYSMNVLLPLASITIISCLAFYATNTVFNQDTLSAFFIRNGISTIVLLALVYLIGLTKNERAYIMEHLKIVRIMKRKR